MNIHPNHAPDTQAPEPPRHRCGRCANPHFSSGGRDDCPNNQQRQEWR